MSDETRTSTPPTLAQRLEEVGIPAGSYEVRPLDAMRRAIARRTTQAVREIPHFPVTTDVSLDALIAERARRRGDDGAGSVTINDCIVKASAIALVAVPEANASYMPDGLIDHHHADIAVTVAIPGGLITPIVRAAETKPVEAISAELKQLVARARAKRLLPDEYQGGTFSISNLGMFGVKSFGSIINSPHGCILSVGASETRAIWGDGGVHPLQMMSVTLTCDHRVVDGVIAARWLQAFGAALTQPAKLFAE